MRPSQARYVTACQQLLALAVVLVVLAPAAGVATLDVVDRLPGGEDGPSAGELRVVPGRASYSESSGETSVVETAPVDAVVTEHPLTTDDGRMGRSARTSPESLTDGTVTSRAEPVDGYGAVGVTWAHGEGYDEDEIALQVRTRTGDGGWTSWDDLEYHDEHAPDPDTAEGRAARPGTEPVFVGDVDEVQVRAETPGAAVPDDLSMAVITPGDSEGTAVEAPEYEGSAAPSPTSEGDVDLMAAADGAPRPTIYSRQQWGADESLRSGRPSYGVIKGGFVHHTVNANDYTRDQVPGILRSIYAYHTRSRGWSDVGYNFLVDKFGRIWEGRAGGVTRPVIGAHTLGYNHESFAMSAIGNFDVTGPPDAMVKAYGALMGWKLSISGVNAAATSVSIAGRRFAAINGHRDAGSTACPGRYLYAKLPQIRSLARAAQTSGEDPSTPPTPTPPPPPAVSSTPALDSDLMGSPHPDLVVRRGSDNRVLVLPTAGGTAYAAARSAGVSVPASARLVASPDLTGDGIADLVAIDGGRASIHPGDGTGRFGAASKVARGFDGLSLVAAAGDLNGDGRHDLVGRLASNGRLVAFLGTPAGGFRKTTVASGWGAYGLVAGVGDVDGDGYDDLVARDREGRLFLHRGARPTDARPARMTTRRQLSTAFGGVNAMLGVGDTDRDGRPELLVRRNGGQAFLHPLEADLTIGAGYGPINGLSGLTSMSTGPDLTGDGWPDVLARKRSGVVVVPHAGTTETLALYTTDVDARGANALMNVGDWDGDGHGDLLMRQGGGALLLLRGNGRGGFADRIRIATGFGDVTGLAPVGDVTRDGRADLLGTRGGRHYVWASAGTGALGTPLAAPSALVSAMRPSGLGLGSYASWNAVSDLTGSGRPDLVLFDRTGKRLWSLNQRAAGTYDSRRLLARWSGNWNLVG